MPPLRIKACSAVKVPRSRAISRTPLVSRSRRCTSSRVSRGREARSASMTPKLMPLPAVHRDPGGLVDHQQVLVLENNRALQQLQQAAGGPLGRCIRVDAHRRQAQLIALLNAVLRIHPFAVDPHLTLAQQL